MHNFVFVVPFLTLFSTPFVFPFFSAEDSKNPTVELLEVKFFTNDEVKIISQNCFKIPTTFKEIAFSCKSSYPTEWKFTDAPHKDNNIKDIKISKSRAFTAFDNNGTFSFHSNLTLRFKDPSVLQNLTCRGAKRQQLQMKNTSVIVKEGQACHIKFCLESKVDTAGEVLRSLSMSIVHNNRNREGLNPGCLMQLEVDSENKRFNCKNTIAAQNENSDLADNDTESTDEQAQQLPESPILTRLITCHTEDECNAIFKSDDHECNGSTVILNCTHANCKSLNPSMEPGIIVCSNGVTSVARRYFVTNALGNEKHLTLHFEKHWKDSGGESIGIQTVNESFYVGKNFSLTCKATSWRFSYGFVWSLLNLNDSVNILYTHGEETIDETEFMYINTMNFQVNKSGDYEIACIGPKWNSFDWVYSTINITIKDPVEPYNVSIIKLEGKPEENITAILECKANGDPLPKYEWKFRTPTGLLTFGADQKNPYFSVQNINDGTFSRIGIRKSTSVKWKAYICNASSSFGSEERSYIMEDKSDETRRHRRHIVYAIVSTLVMIAAGTGFGCACFIIRKQRKRLKELSDDEIHEFQHGNPESNNAMLLPYNVAYEISPEKIFIEGIVLGEGQFAQVVTGKVCSENVAIKTLKPSADVLYFKALLSELKILCYVGEHPNIVNLIGASTKNIRKKEVYIIMEYCANGSMLQMLRKSREMFINRLNNGNDDYKISRKSVVNYENGATKHLTTQDLAKWACDIANGMEFLRQKNVIHGDLAARNVLISASMQAKVGDFGLAKQLFEYSIYIQKLNCPLPLKWMALESLQDLEFSLDSDIWSYGITMWEIFSLGQTPYPGIPQWDFESYKLLINGYRMEKPDFANNAIYELMLRCWDSDPKQRPSFKELRFWIQEELSRL